MKLYELSLKDPWKGCLHGGRVRNTPPVVCPKCGWRMTESVDLPSVDPSKFDFFLPGKPIPVESWVEIKPRLAPYYPPGFPVQQQQSLGPLHTSSQGKLEGMFVSVGSGICCFEKDLFLKFMETEVYPIQAFPVFFKRKSKYEGRLVEGHSHGVVSFGNSIHPRGELRTCELCGMNNILQLIDARICIKKSSLPTQGDYFAVQEWGSVRIVTERFRDCAAPIFANLSFREVPVVDE
ncbi:MAG: double-CXXCG motif protein [Verrucomicrobiota bacterium]